MDFRQDISNVLSNIACDITTFNVLPFCAHCTYKWGFLRAYSLKNSASNGAKFAFI